MLVTRRRYVAALATLLAGAGVTGLLSGCGGGAQSSPGAAAANGTEVSEVRLTRQYGMGYLPLVVMEGQGLIEAEAKAAGLPPVKVSWSTLGSGAASTDALLSGSVDFTGVGVAPAITLWSKTQGEVKALAALGEAPMILNVNRPEVKSIQDLTEKDRIGLPAAKVSIQAVVLQMAAVKAFGESQWGKLDPLTVSMKHPDAMAALLSGGSEITGHLTQEPFDSLERRNPRVHSILNSFELLGGPHTHVVLCATQTFHDKNPRTTAAVLAALRKAIAFIEQDPKAAAELYVKTTGGKEKPEDLLAEIKGGQTSYHVAPQRITEFSDFMHQTGAIKSKPADWKELFFPEIQSEAGS